MYPSYDHSEPQPYYGESHEHDQDMMMQYLQPSALPNGNAEYMDHELNQQAGSTASGKSSCFSTAPETQDDEWRRKTPQDWNSTDVLHWIAYVATNSKISYEDVCASEFNIDGRTLLSFTLQDFEIRDPNIGRLLFDSLQGYTGNYVEDLQPLGPSTISYTDTQQPDSDSFSPYSDSNDPYSYPPRAPLPVSMPSDSESGQSDRETDPVPKKIKRPPGRPPGAKAKTKSQNKTGRLWEFIRNLLHNPETCPSLICWEDHDEGVFRFVKSEKVANIWGARKNNSKMNYEKLSRAMRYYYPSKVFMPVLGRKLVYKFGPNAKNWRSENPNFRLP